MQIAFLCFFKQTRRRVLLGANIISGIFVGAIAALSLAGELSIWKLLILVAGYGASEAVFGPAYGAIIPELVDREVLTQANSLNQLNRPLAIDATMSVSDAPRGIVPSRRLAGRGTGAASSDAHGAPAIGSALTDVPGPARGNGAAAASTSGARSRITVAGARVTRTTGVSNCHRGPQLFIMRP